MISFELEKVKLNTLQKIRKKFTSNTKKKQLLEMVKKDTQPFVPKKTGFLRRNVKITPDTITYTAKYARYQYYGKFRTYTTPGTGNRWLEKSRNKHMKKWKKKFKF